MVRADEVFVAEGHEATRYSGGFLPLQWLVAGWCGKQLHKVAVRVMNVDLLEPVRPVLRPVCDCNPGGLQFFNGGSAVMQLECCMVTAGGLCSGEGRETRGTSFPRGKSDVNLGVPGLEPEAGKGEIGTGSRFHPENVLIEMTTGLQVRRDDGDVINGPDLEKRKVDHAGMMEKHLSAGKGN